MVEAPKELIEMVQNIVRVDGRPNPFKNDRPGKDLFYGFMNRHPQISIRDPRQLGKERAYISPAKIKAYFENFIVTVVSDRNILKNPSRLYNADESGFSMCPKTGNVLGLRAV